MSDFHASEKAMDFARGCGISFDLLTGRSDEAAAGERRISQLEGMFCDERARKAVEMAGDPVVYAFHELPVPQTAGDLAFGYSVVNPGKVGDEYYFTRGHYHRILETGEVYHCMSGHGYLLLENPEGDWSALELLPGRVVYVPPRYAHRSINVSPSEKLATYFVFRADAGHDYGTIKTRGYRKLLVERNGIPAVADNPRWG